MIYLNIPGITGNCTEVGYVGQIIVDSYNHGLSAQLNHDPSNTERTTGKPQWTEINFSKSMDSSTPQLYAACAGAKPFATATICVTRTEGDKHMLLIKYVLTDVLVSGISTSGSTGSGLPQEGFSLNFTSITGQFTQQKKDSTAKGQAAFGWDLATGLVKAPA